MISEEPGGRPPSLQGKFAAAAIKYFIVNVSDLARVSTICPTPEIFRGRPRTEEFSFYIDYLLAMTMNAQDVFAHCL